MGKICGVKQRTKTHKKRKGFLGVRKDVVNIVNTGINLLNVNSESIKDNLVNSTVHSTVLPKSDNEQILTVLLMPVFLVMIFVNFYVRCMNNVHWFLVKDMKRSKDLHHCCI